MNKYPKLWALSQNIEGLVTRLGVHASGVVCVNGSFIEYGSYMRTSKGQLVTAFDLHDQEECALIKYDMLTVSALDRIHQTMNYLLEDKVIEWQGSLKKTYNKYLAPEVLDYTSEEMWNIVGQNGISSLFQFDTIVGGQAIRQIQPRNLKQLAIANSIMRLMSDGEQPIDIYVEQKNNPQLWYDKMYNYGLTDKEIKVLEPYLKEKEIPNDINVEIDNKEDVTNEKNESCMVESYIKVTKLAENDYVHFTVEGALLFNSGIVAGLKQTDNPIRLVF